MVLFRVLLSLEDEVSTIYNLEGSSHWKLRDDVERSLDVKSKGFIELSLENWFHFFDVKKLPGLTSSVGALPDLDEGFFSILVALNFDNLGGLVIDELATLVLEALPPLSNCLSDGKSVGSTLAEDLD